ncbi:hypothetical protein JTB14_034664 [Gonioctena quinquepunctata]|nr:hypothetical protein JTB14_034664 [Gonioctena quinquepunctata]
MLGEPQKTHPAKIVQTRFGETVLLEFEKQIVILPQRVNKDYKPHIANFLAEKYAVVFRETKDVREPFLPVSYEIIELKGILGILKEMSALNVNSTLPADFVKQSSDEEVTSQKYFVTPNSVLDQEQI